MIDTSIRSNRIISLDKSQAPMGAAVDLFRSLNQKSIRYCHWKSNSHLTAAFQGKTDFDLLVDPEHRQAFEETLREHQVKQVYSAPGREYPGVQNFLGYDPGTGKLYHLHVHYQLVLGEQFVKNFRLPLEQDFLGDVIFRNGLKTPAPEKELIILCLRALLKYRDRDALKDLLSIRSPSMPGHIRKEIRWLLDQTTPQEISAQLDKWSGVVPGAAVREFLHIFSAGALPGTQFFRLRGQVRKELSGYQRANPLRARLKYFREVWRRRKGSLGVSSKKRMRLRGGGRSVAIIGVDGAGKSTVIAELARWMSWRLNVQVVYMGSSKPSLATQIIKRIVKAGRFFNRGTGRVFGGESLPARLSQAGLQFLENLRFLGDARDRHRRYQASCLAVEEGTLVLYDRFPLDAVRVEDHPLDGPRIRSHSNGHPSPLTARLSHLEKELYQRILPPEHVVILRVSPEVSLARKPQHKRAVIEEKAQGVAQAGRISAEQIVIEADQPLEQVILQVKTALWSWL